MSIIVGKSAGIIARLENSGEPVIATIHMVETTGLGSLLWADKPTGIVLVNDEKTEVINDIVGQSQCILSVTPDSIVSIKQMNSSGAAIGSDLTVVASSYGRTIDLNTQLATGTELLACYNKGGSVQNELRGLSVGTAKVIISADVSLEKGLSQTVEIEITAKPTKPPSPTPAPPTPTPGPTPPSVVADYETFEMSGPSVLGWFRSGYYWPGHGFGNIPGSFSPEYEYFLLNMSRWGVIRKWMTNGEGSPYGDDIQLAGRGSITGMMITGSVMMVWAGGNNPGSRGAAYAIMAPPAGGTTLTVSADYEYTDNTGTRRGSLTKSVFLGPG